jgi:ABC-2 type transport system permease protein
MAVYQRSFRPYAGALTASATRFLVPARYALRDLLKSKLFVVFLTLCFVFPLGCVFAIYLRHNADLMANLVAAGIEIDEWMPIDNTFFGIFMRVQGTLAFFLVLFSGPRLVSRDLANNGLALYLCRPFSKTQYVLGKLTVLMILASAVTWIPGLLLWLLQTGLEGASWGLANLRSAAAIFIGSWIWMVVLGLLALAISAWVKWRPVAGFFLLLVYFGGAFFAQVVDALFHSQWGYVLDLHHTIRRVWAQLFATPAPFFFSRPIDVPMWAAWGALAALIGLSVWLLSRRIRAYEVIS